MSRADPQLLRREIELLRSEIQLLTLRVDQLEERSFGAEAEGSERSRLREEQHSQSPSLVSHQTEAHSFSGQESSNRSPVPIDPSDRAGREQLARTIGEFIRRSLDGLPRGPSGRDRLRLQNRYYLVFADFNGEQLEEPVFTERFSEIKDIVKRGNSAGASVFIGLPTLWESKIVFQTVGIPLPQRLRDA